MTTPNPTDSEVTEGLEPPDRIWLSKVVLLSDDMANWHAHVTTEQIETSDVEYVRASVAAPPGETGWLLEKMHEGNVHYISADYVLQWTDDPNKALRLARRQDAEALSTIVEDCDKIAAHEWPATISGEPPSCAFCDSGLVFNEQEIVALSDLYERTGLRTAQILKHALALYQLHIVKGIDLPLESKLPPAATASPVAPSTTPAGEVSAAPVVGQWLNEIESACISALLDVYDQSIANAPVTPDYARGTAVCIAHRVGQIREAIAAIRATAPLATPVGDRDAKFPPSALIQGIVERAGKARAELAELLQVPAVWPEILSAVRQRVVAAPADNDAEGGC